MTFKPADFLAFIKSHARDLHHGGSGPGLAPILVVDDESAVRQYVARVLQSTGLEVILASDGPDALAKATALTRCPHLITDLVMPGMTGEELARGLRERYPELRVLYLTGFADRLFMERTLLGNDEAFLEKPFTANALLEAVALLATGHPVASALPKPVAEPPG